MKKLKQIIKHIEMMYYSNKYKRKVRKIIKEYNNGHKD